MKHVFALAICLVVSFSLFAQASRQRCATFDVMQYREQQSPGYLQGVRNSFEQAQQIVNANKANRAVSDTLYKVQMVFHVVHTSPIENIPDSVIYSQIDIINEDFRRRNADTTLTRSEFLPVAGDANIQFELATVDPDGNPTTGITRTAGGASIIGYSPFTDDVKVEPGGKAPWPTDRYVNVWVCNVFFGIVLGYAHPPYNAPNWDTASLNVDSARQGVVLHYAAVGRNFSQPIDPTVDGGRSLTHELGHYFGLRHIWGDSTGCANDDGIADTPFSSDASQQTCDTSINSCVDPGVDFVDMIENFMDYSDDRCVNMFTKGQIDIMRAMLQTSRAGVAKVETTTGIGNVQQNFDLVELYPNPTTGMVYLNAQVKGGNTYSYEIYNAMGAKIAAEYELTQGIKQRTINMLAQPAGVYFVKVYSGTETIVKKLLLAH